MLGIRWMVLLSVALIVTGCGRRLPPKRVVVSGGSMAPSIPGEHFLIRCQDCKYSFPVDAVTVPQSQNAVCPNCGCRENPIDKRRPRIIHGEVVPVEQIERWDVVALKGDNRIAKGLRSDYLVKRIVGLPQERIEISGGNVVVDGIVIAKDRAAQNVLRALCYDSDYQPVKAVDRFVADEPTGWTTERGQLFFKGDRRSNNPQWFTYRHVKGYLHSGSRYQESVIEDSYAYNQNLARRLHRVNEVEIELDLKCDHWAELWVRFQLDAYTISVRFAGDQCMIDIGDRNWQRFRMKEIADVCKINVSNYDRRCVVAIDGQRIAECLLPDPNSGGVALALGAVEGEIHISRCRIYRDVFYLNQPNQRQVPNSTTLNKSKFSTTLGPSEYFVLGDNVPMSRDSRQFGPVSRRQIIGVANFNATGGEPWESKPN